MIRYVCAIIWTGILICFSYGELVLNFFIKNDVKFDDKIIEMHDSSLMILVNVGLIAMLYVDSLITHILTKSNFRSKLAETVFFISIFIAIFLTVFAHMVKEGVVLANWFKLSYLFIVFIAMLIIYKAESLREPSFACDNDILPSKI
jgi:quinol-cytochrome oxidoreductase complex cytochrome b subunit